MNSEPDDVSQTPAESINADKAHTSNEPLMPTQEKLAQIKAELAQIADDHDDDWRTDNYSEEDWNRLLSLIRMNIRGTPPRCVAEFRLTSTANRFDSPEHCFVTSWEMACRCGHSHGKVLGYSLARYNDRYDGPLYFLRPLSLACSKCARVTQIVDNHGYHEELARREGGIGSANIRGTGEPEVFCCHHCDGTEFTVETSFIYPQGVFDLFLEFPKTSAQDYFSLLEVRGTCQKCGKVSLIMQYES